MCLNRSSSSFFKTIEYKGDGLDITPKHAMLSFKYNQQFDFDWNDYQTIKANEKRLPEITAFLEQATTAEKLKTLEKWDLAWLCYKVGTFYNHIKRDPDLALPHLKAAENVFTDQGLAWTHNHLAFSYQQKLAAAKRQNKKEEMQEYATKAFEYCEKAKRIYTTSDTIANQDRLIEIAAFAYCVQALTEYEIGNINTAITNYRLALDLYESIDELDDQYARAKNRWAMMLAENDETKKAQTAFEELEIYWSAKLDALNPYPARFYVSYADFLAKNDKTIVAALEKYKKAYEILRVTDGEQAGFTKDIGKKIATIEKQLQDEKQARYSPTLYHANNVTHITSVTALENKEIKRPGL